MISATLVFLSICRVGEECILSSAFILLLLEGRLRHPRSHHQVRDGPSFSVHWRSRRPEGTAFSVPLPLSMHHYLAAEAVSGSLWLGRLPGEHMGTDAAVRSGSTKREWQDGRPSWMRPQGRFALRGCVSLQPKAGAASNGPRAGSFGPRESCQAQAGRSQRPRALAWLWSRGRSWQERRDSVCCLADVLCPEGLSVTAFPLCLLPSAPRWGPGRGPGKMLGGGESSSADLGDPRPRSPGWCRHCSP